MRINTKDMVSVTELGRDLSRRISDAHAGRTVVVLKNNQPAAALVSPEEMDRLQDLDERQRELDEREEDLRLFSLAIVRLATDTGDRIALDDFLSELGLDLADEDGSDA